MQIQLITFFLFLFVSNLGAQQFFPIKKDKKWGLMNVQGDIAIEPIYDAIGEFKQYGYAVMQRAGRVGLLGVNGGEIISPKYDDIKVLDSLLVAVMDEAQWMVINLQEEVILPKGYQRVHVWESQYLAFMENKKWGIRKVNGQLITAPEYDEINYKNGYFETKKEEALGLLNPLGKELLSPQADEIKIYNDSLFFFKIGHRWGAVNHQGKQVLEPRFDNFAKAGTNFIKLLDNGKKYVFSLSYGRLITQGEYDNYYPFSKKYLIVKKNRQLGLIDYAGNSILPIQYNEIQAYTGERFRVNQQGKWGILDRSGEAIIPFDYQYIAPLRTAVCVVRKNNKLGIVNIVGQEIIAPQYDRIELADNKAKAYVGEALTVLSFDEDGQLKEDNEFGKHFTFRIGGGNSPMIRTAIVDEENYLLENFEWFYHPPTDRWGLRKYDGTIQIEPTFDEIQIERDLGFTLVGIEKLEKKAFERTTYRFNMVYGLVRNEVGLLVTEVDFLDIRLQDFDQGLPAARCIFSNGRHGLVSNIGKILRKDFAYIGVFRNGLARTSINGKLSGKMKIKNGLGPLSLYLNSFLASNYVTDYTQYDRDFNANAELVCEDCTWGYIDTLGQVLVTPQYSFAQDFTNEVGIVECEGKKGMINSRGEALIPCRYDGIDFLENTDNQIVKVFVEQHKYGLVDTLGQITVSAVYEAIGSFSNGRLAVKRNGSWGFVDNNGLEVIPCRFQQVNNFKEGMASVKLGRKWGFIDKQGNVEIDFKYSRAGNFNNGLTWIYTGGGYGFLNPQGEEVIASDLDKAFDFENGIARVAIEGKYGLIDTLGDYVLRPKFSNIDPFNKHGLAIVRYGNNKIQYGVIDRSGKLVTDKNYRSIGSYRQGLAAVKYKNGYGFINTDGQIAIPTEYSKVADFQEDRVAVQKNGDCGYLRPDGSLAVDFKYSKCLDFSDGKAVVYKGSRKAGLVDKNGKEIIKPSLNKLLGFSEDRGLVRDEKYRFYYITDQARIYDGYYEKASQFQHGVAVVQMDGKWGIINQKGIEIIPPKYDQIESFKDGYAKVRIKGFNGLTNLKGELIVAPDYEYISYAGRGLFRVEQGDKIGYFDVNGKWVWELKK